MAKKQAHHGGAWKVAYADFVTAMMALFMVLWISAQDQDILIATSQYFQNPFQSPMDATSGVLPFNSNKASSTAGEQAGEDKEKDRNSEIQMTFLNTVAAEFYRLLHLDQDYKEKPIEVQVTSDGLRIIIYDRAQKPVFVGNTAELTEWGNFVLQNLAWTIDRHKFNVTIDGHTRANLKFEQPNYDSWDLSSGRALTAQKTIVHYAADTARMMERVSGLGDTLPMPGELPDSEMNQRITLNLTLTGKRRATAPKTAATPAPAASPARPSS